MPARYSRSPVVSAQRPGLFSDLAGLLTALMRARVESARQRRALSRLDDRLLGDVGLTRAQVDAELRRLSFWR